MGRPRAAPAECPRGWAGWAAAVRAVLPARTAPTLRRSINRTRVGSGGGGGGGGRRGGRGPGKGGPQHWGGGLTGGGWGWGGGGGGSWLCEGGSGEGSPRSRGLARVLPGWRRRKEETNNITG